MASTTLIQLMYLISFIESANQWIPYSSTTQYMYVTQCMGLPDAQQYCSLLGGQLASAHFEAQQYFIASDVVDDTALNGCAIWDDGSAGIFVGGRLSGANNASCDGASVHWEDQSVSPLDGIDWDLAGDEPDHCDIQFQLGLSYNTRKFHTLGDADINALICQRIVSAAPTSEPTTVIPTTAIPTTIPTVIPTTAPFYIETERTDQYLATEQTESTDYSGYDNNKEGVFTTNTDETIYLSHNVSLTTNETDVITTGAVALKDDQEIDDKERKDVDKGFGIFAVILIILMCLVSLMIISILMISIKIWIMKHYKANSLTDVKQIQDMIVKDDSNDKPGVIAMQPRICLQIENVEEGCNNANVTRDAMKSDKIALGMVSTRRDSDSVSAKHDDGQNISSTEQ